MRSYPTPSFESPALLEDHVQSILAFYAPRAFSPEGGLRSCFLDNGDCFDADSRQLVRFARCAVNYATAYQRYKDPKHLDWAKWGLDFLTSQHRQENGHDAWLLKAGAVTDRRVMAYGHAFVILAAASCVRAGISSAIGDTQ